MQTLIFDLGGVLVNYDLLADARALASVGLPDYYEWKHHPELMAIANPYLNGLMPEQEFLERLRPLCSPGVSDEQMLWSMMAVMNDLPPTRIEALLALRRRYRVFLLSNINERTWRYCERQFLLAGHSPSKCFDGIFLSYEMGLAKPDAAIYERVLAEAGAEASTTLFLDDTRANVEAARALGIDSWLVEMNHPEPLLDQLLQQP